MTEALRNADSASNLKLKINLSANERPVQVGKETEPSQAVKPAEAPAKPSVDLSALALEPKPEPVEEEVPVI